MAGSILQVFLNADLRCGHDGLAQLAKKHGMNVAKIESGQFLIFINGQRSKVKIYAASNVIAYLKLDKGRLNMDTIREIPRVFAAKGRMDYDEALKLAVEKSLSKRGKLEDLEVHALGKA